MSFTHKRLRSALTGLRRTGGLRRGRLADLIEQVAFPLAASRALPDPAHDLQLRIASYNIHKCVGTDGRFDPARTATVIGELDCDILVLQEADRRIGARAGLLDLAALERDTGLRLMPVATRPVSHGWHGNALLARAGVLLRTARIPLPCAEPRGAVLAELDFDGRPLRIVGAHLGLLKRSRHLQAHALAEALDRMEPMPTLLSGDLNEWRPDGRSSSLHGLAPVFGDLGTAGPSFPARRPVFALDRIAGWPGGLVRERAVHQSPAARLASDHLPVLALVDLSLSAADDLSAVA